MIATVRISPVERWCKAAKKGCSPVYAGQQVRIFTNSMQVYPKHYCGGARWELEQDSTNFLRELAGKPPVSDVRAVCEHMLEMD